MQASASVREKYGWIYWPINTLKTHKYISLSIVNIFIYFSSADIELVIEVLHQMDLEIILYVWNEIGTYGKLI